MVEPASIATALSIGCAVWLLLHDVDQPRARLAELMSPRESHANTVEVRQGRSVITPRRAAVLAGVTVAILWWGWGGLITGAVVSVILPPLLGRLESRQQRQRRHDLTRQAPMVADLLAATLASGALPRECLATLAHSIDEPAASVVREVGAGLDLGAPPAGAWAPMLREPALASLGRAIIRSAESGAPLTEILAALAEDQRRTLRTRAQAAARTAGVHAVAPLALCFLPAFIVVGVIPVVASLALSAWWAP